MIEICRTYKFKEEFCKELGISNCQVERKLNDLLNWLRNFYDFEFKKSRPFLITIKDIIGEYKPLPRKVPSQDELTREKKEKYDAFTKFSLTVEY